MIQTTSTRTYQEIADQGILNKLALEVLEFIDAFQDEPQFDGKISQADASRNLNARSDTCDSIRPRFVELVKAGVIREAGRKVDPTTGREVIGYRTTGNLAQRVKTRRVGSYRQLLKEAAKFVTDPKLAEDIEYKLLGTS